MTAHVGDVVEYDWGGREVRGRVIAARKTGGRERVLIELPILDPEGAVLDHTRVTVPVEHVRVLENC